MSDEIKHECGIALLKLKKPLSFYQEKYGTSVYGLNKMYLLMEKQHNRGQDGAGIANIKFDVEPGHRYISRKRSISSKPIQDIFASIKARFDDVADIDPEKLKDPIWMKHNLPFTGELFLGHLRYGTFGKNSIESCHPFLRQNNWMSRNLVVAGNFNLTNVDELFGMLVELGQHPKEYADTVTVMEKIGHFLDVENERLFRKFKTDKVTNKEISKLISEHIDIQRILQKASEDWDGGYAMAGLLGHGDAFVLRDPAGIRPVFYYQDDEVIVVASERPVIQTAFNLKKEDVKELSPGHALVMKKEGEAEEKLVIEPLEKAACSFERIYFSRAGDYDIYRERKDLGKLLADKILGALDGKIENTVFSFIPNTAEVAFYGMVKGIERTLDFRKANYIKEQGDNLSREELVEILQQKIKIEKVAIKDAKLRTFITGDDERNELVSHVYDITYGSVKPGDTLVVIDDSIVRGTTLKESILKILDRLEPKKIIIVSSAPQIRYPDCYGIDMAKLGDFVAFQAAISLLNASNRQDLIRGVYEKCKAQDNLPKEDVVNHVKEIYEPFTAEEIEVEVSKLLKPQEVNSEVEILFQSVEALRKACPDHKGDWYFTGNYPTPGGNKVVNRAFINFYEGNNKRAY